jgi:hypothetical protein
MLYIGLAFLLDWLLIQVFTLDVVKSVLVTAIVFILLGLLTEVGNLPGNFPWKKTQ